MGTWEGVHRWIRCLRETQLCIVWLPLQDVEDSWSWHWEGSRLKRLSGTPAGPCTCTHLPLGPYRSISLPVPAFVPSVPAYAWWSSQIWRQIKSGTTQNNVKHWGLLPPLLKLINLLFSMWDLLQTLHRMQMASAHLPVHQWGAELAVGSRDGHLLGTSSLQICPFPTLCEDEEDAHRPHSVAPASPHLSKCLGTHPLFPIPCRSLSAQMSQLASFSLTGFWSSSRPFWNFPLM